MTDFQALLKLRDDNERAQQAILLTALEGYEENYERNKFGKIMNFFDRGFNRDLRTNTDRHAGGSIQLTREVLRKAARELSGWPGLTEDQRIELGRYFTGTEFEGNVYLEDRGR